MNPLLLLGLGAGLLVLSSNSKSSSKTEEDSKKSSSKSSTGALKSPTPSSKSNFPTFVVCGKYEIKKNEKCISFWNDITRKKITDKIIEKAYNFMTTPYVGYVELPKEGEIGKDYIPLLCLKINSTTMNPNAEKIITETILETWEDIKKGDLPPKSTAPLWIKIVWDEVVKIYTKEICQNEPLL